MSTEEANETHRRRGLRLRRDAEGRWLLISGHLADAEGAVVERAITRLAEGAPPDPVTGVYDPFESRCGDALVELASTSVGAEADGGQALGLGRRTRQVPRWLSRQLRQRDGGCRFPGCGRTRWLHAHHLRHWAQGGSTDPPNLVMLCGYHHRLLHEGGWHVEGHPDGDLRFIHPGGTALSTRPVPLRADVRERVLA